MPISDTRGTYRSLFDTSGREYFGSKKSSSEKPFAGKYSPEWKKYVMVGPNRRFKTLESAFNSIYNDTSSGKYSPGSPVSVGWSSSKALARIAKMRTVVVVDPGEYTISGEYLEAGGIDVVGFTGDPKDVVINSGNGFVFNARLDMYTRGITYNIVPRTTGGKNYTFHLTGLDLDLPSTFIFESCVFKDHGSTVSGSWIGWDGPDYSMAFFYDCLVDSDRVSNYHPDITPVGLEIHYINTTLNVKGLQGDVVGMTFLYKNVTVNGSPKNTENYTEPVLINGSHRASRYTELSSEATLTIDGIKGEYKFEANIVYFYPIPTTRAGYIDSVSYDFLGKTISCAIGASFEKSSGGSIVRAPANPLIYGRVSSSSDSQVRTPRASENTMYVTSEHVVWVGIVFGESVTVPAVKVQRGSVMTSSGKTEYPAYLWDAVASEIEWMPDIKLNMSPNR